MWSKNKSKWIHSLSVKKFRDAERMFLAEGAKTVTELYGHFHCRILMATNEFLRSHEEWIADELIEVSQQQLEQTSLQRAPRDVLAVFDIPDVPVSPHCTADRLVLALDAIQDPGNLGTIIRLADWFGVEDIYCSSDTADAFAPKVVQATMGALAHVRIHYVNLVDFLSSQPKDVPVYGTFLNGTDIYRQPLTKGGILIMGNEGNGISATVEPLVNRRLYIPNYPAGRPTAESLNVAVATAVVCAEFRRRLVCNPPVEL